MNKNYKKIKEKIEKHHLLFVIFVVIRAYGIYFLNRISNYKLERIKFFKELGYQLNLKNPKSFNEKIIWKKINDRNPLLPVTADKYEVRSYIREMLGEERANEILIPLYYVTDQPATIPFKDLPSAFIVKPNHTSGRSIVVEKGAVNQNDIIRTCDRWLKTPYGLEKLEWAYQPIKRKIVIEKLLRSEDGSNPVELKFHVFHGKCKLVFLILDKQNNPYRSYYDEHWNYLLVKKTTRPRGPKIEKPKNYEVMLKLAEILSKPFDYLRIDFYNIKGKIYLGELTNYPGSGTTKFESQSFDFELGEYWKVEKKYWEKSNKEFE